MIIKHIGEQVIWESKSNYTDCILVPDSSVIQSSDGPESPLDWPAVLKEKGDADGETVGAIKEGEADGETAGAIKEGEADGEKVGAADMSSVMFKGKFTRWYVIGNPHDPNFVAPYVVYVNM